MTEAKKTPAGAKAAAARAERNGGPRSVEWRDLTFTLPSQLPATVMFDIAEIDSTDGPAALFRFIKDMLGDEQYERLRAYVAEQQIPLEGFDEVLADLLDSIFGEYGVGLGESQASGSS